MVVVVLEGCEQIAAVPSLVVDKVERGAGGEGTGTALARQVGRIGCL